MDTMTERMRDVWAAGADYNPIATREVLASELLARAADVRDGERVLDVAAATGNTAIAAARRNARVTAVDFAPNLLESARRRADVEGLKIDTQVADAQDLPFEDGSFDVVLSTWGVMYATDQQRAADELVRVCRPGSRIGLVAWTPDRLVARLQEANDRFLQRPPGPSPQLWGNVDHCLRLLGNRVTLISATIRTIDFIAPSAKAQVEFLLEHLPPWRAAYARLEPETREQAAAAVAEVFQQANRATDGTLVAPAEYLELVAEVA